MPGSKAKAFPTIGKLTEEHRVKIANSNILSALIDHTLGKREMTSTQVTAGIALIRKVLPDLAQTELKGALDIATQSKEQRDAATAAATRANT